MVKIDNKVKIDILWREWEYRHNKFWEVYYQSIALIGILLVAPFVIIQFTSDNVVKIFGYEYSYFLQFFPILAFFAVIRSYLAVKHEYIRLTDVNVEYKALMKDTFKTYGSETENYNKKRSYSINKFIDNSLVTGTIICVLEAIVLLGAKVENVKDANKANTINTVVVYRCGNYDLINNMCRVEISK